MWDLLGLTVCTHFGFARIRWGHRSLSERAGNPGLVRMAYCSVVICKNAKAHRVTNLMFGHKIPLAETDAFESLPVSGPFNAKCDECGHEDSYKPEEVVRVESQLPES